MKSKGWVAGITWQAFRRPNADRTQGIGLGVLLQRVLGFKDSRSSCAFVARHVTASFQSAYAPLTASIQARHNVPN